MIQPELSLLEFKKRFGTERACQNALARWLFVPEVQAQQGYPHKDAAFVAMFKVPFPGVPHLGHHFS